MKITLFIPCLVDQFYPEVGISTVRILEKLGNKIVYPRAQTCCGQPAFNNGYWRETESLATRFINMFGDSEVIVAPSGSCVSMVKIYYEKLSLPSPIMDRYLDLRGRIYELSEFIVNFVGTVNLGSMFDARVTYHDSCHLLRDLGIENEPRELLRNVQGLELVELKDSRECCGFGGTFSVKFSHISTKMGLDKTQNIINTNAQYVVANDCGCLMHIQGMLRRNQVPVKTLHIAQLLDNNRLL